MTMKNRGLLKDLERNLAGYQEKRDNMMKDLERNLAGYQEKRDNMNVLEKILEEIEHEAMTNKEIGRKQCEGMARAMNIIRSHMDEAENDNWIPVEDRLPSEFDEDDDGIITIETTSTSVLENGERATFIDDYDLNTKEFLTPYKVVAWRKRPKPYKPKKQD